MSIAILIVEDDKYDREGIRASIKLVQQESFAGDQFFIDPQPSLTPQEIEEWIEAHQDPILLVLDIFQLNPQKVDLDELIPNIIEKYLQPLQPPLHKIALLVYTIEGSMKREARSQEVPPLHYIFKFRQRGDKYEKLRQALQKSIAYLKE